MIDPQDVMYVKNLDFSYSQVPLFKNFSIHLHKNTFISIIGPNGSGKTTLLKHLLRVLPLKPGTLYYPHGDAQQYSQKEIAHLASYVPQVSRMEYDFTLFECVAMARYSHNSRFSLLSKEDIEIIEDAIDTVGLMRYKNHAATDLSGNPIML